MKQLKQLLLVMAIALICNNYAQAQTTPFNHYSEWMAKSRENYVYINNGKNDFWRYDDGLMYESILDTYEHYKNNGADLSGTTLLDEVKWYLNNSLTKGTQKPNNYKSSELDDVRPAKLVWKYYNTYPTDTDRDYLDNCEYVMDDIENMRRAIPNDNTSPWEHKESYGNQVWLDGIFMCIPYYTLAGPTIGLNTNSSWTTDYIFQDAYTQIMVTDEKTYDRKTNLWKHAWDALGTRTWADCQNKELYESFNHTAEELAKPVGTGTWQSLHTWGRALGWYVMAIMETIDNMIAYDTAHSTDHSTQINNLKILFKRVVDSYIQYRDESNGCWYCVLDVDDTKVPYSSISVKRPNYLEGTCSSMFTYALLHGVNKGYLPLSYTSLAKKAYKDLVEYFIKADGEKIKLDNCISVAGLDDGAKRRDGSFAYYMDESVIASDSKGVGPFIWASLEAEKMGYTLVKNSSNFSVNFNSLDQTGINVYKWSKVYDEIDNLSAEYTSPTFTAKTVAGTTIANSGITFNSNNPSVATVSPNGTVTLVGTGLATITATKDEMVSYYSVKVNSIQPQVETPAISITEGTNTFIGENTTVTIACDTENADIYYTTDGSEPDNTATHYTGTFTISATTTVKAIAIKTGYDDSEIASETFTQDNTAPTLSSSTPTSGATNISTSGNIVLTFSEAVTVADASKFTLSGGTGSLTTGSITGDGTTTITIPYTGLANETNYTFATAAGAVQDASGNPNAALSNILFTTAVATSSATFDFTGGSTEGLTISKSGTTTNVSYSVTNETYNQIPPLSSGNHFLGVNFTSNSAGVLDVITTSSFTNITSISFDCAADNNSNPQISIYIIDNDNKETEIQSAMVLSSGSTKVWRSNKTGVGVYTLDLSSAPKTGKVHFKFTTGSSGKSGAIDNIVITTQSSTPPTPTTFTLTNTVNTEGYGTVSPTTVANIPSGTATSSSTNTYTVNGTTVTATPTAATAEYTYAFSSWSGLPETVTTNATVTANFTRTAKEYTLDWNSNGGSALSGDYTSGTVAFGTAITAPNDPTRSGYTFNGWNSANDGSGNAPTGTMPAANTTYYAQWTENTPVIEQVATPSITGTTPFTDNTTVTITCATSDANIYYTTNGDTPTSSSTHYTAPFSIDATTTIKAIAIKSGMTNSEVATQTFTKSEGGGGTSATITYNLNVGTSASTTIKNSTSTTDATNITNIDIDQAHDGANEAGASNRTTKLAIKTGDNGVTFDNPTNYELFKFTIATGKQFTPSEIAIKVANVGSSSANDIKYKAVLSDESGHSIDGTYIVKTQDGTVENFVFANSSNTAFIGNVTLKLWAWQIANSNASAFRMGTPLTITGTIEDSGEPIIPTYTVTATSNNNSWGTVSVDKATAAEDATVTITTTPASGYELSSLTATDGESNPVTITNNQFTMPASNVTVNATFAAMEKVATPSITGTTPFTDNTTVTITCATTGATIHYTTDGSTPTASSTTYSSPIAISATTTIKAIAIKSGMTDSDVASATFTKSGGGGGGSGTVLFSQDFDDATEVAYAANTARTITSGNNIVGTDDPSTKFTSITCNAKNDTGIGINSTTGGNSKDYTGKFGAFYNNTSGYWSIVKTTSFASTTPTAIKVEMNAAFSPVSSGSNIGVQFAVGSEFTDELTNTCPALSNCVAGFALPSNNNIRVAKYSTSNANTAINSSSATIINGDSYKYTWIINNTDETLTYKGADGNNTTVAAGCWDLWIGPSRNLAGISQSTTGMSGTSLENIYIGSPFGKKHEFILNDIVVTDLSPAAMRTTTATIKAGKQYATFNTTMDIDFDETDGLQAFVVDNATKSSVHLREVTVVPANTALIIKGAPDTYTLYETKKATESVSDNQLTISNSTVAADNMYYALGTVNGVQGFHRVQNGLTIPTSYVIITDQTAKSFLNFEEEENIATGIDGFATDNGFIVIDDNTPLYNLSGQRVSKSYKGIVIINGKKVLRK